VRLASLFLLLALVSCGEPDLVDCTKLNTAETLSCMERNEAQGEPAMLLACLPFSSPEKIKGVWILGFEKNDFFAGEWPDEPPPVGRVSHTEVVVSKERLERLRSSAPYDALWVELTGRRSLCRFTGLTPHLIVADNLEVRRRASVVAR